MTNMLEGIDRCPHCQVAVPLLTAKYIGPDLRGGDGNVPVWGVYECSNCGSLVTAVAWMNRNEATQNAVAHLQMRKPNAFKVFPSPAYIDVDLPDRPRRYLEQAVAALHAPDGAAMLAGSAVDAMLKLKGYLDGSVYARIKEAVTKGDLTPNMSEWAHAVRLESNKPRHADLDESHATLKSAKQTIEFAKALGDFLFVFPARVEKGKKKSEEALGSADEVLLLPSNAVS